MAHQSGFENVVASMGTALTPAQVALLLRYGSKIVLAYDVDAAGAKAGAFGATELLRLVTELAGTTDGPSLVDVGIVKLPDGKDPDEVVRDQPDVWRAAVERPIPVVEYLIEEAAAAHDLRDLGGRKRAVDAIKPTLRALRDPVIRDGYAAAAARRIGVDESTIREAMRRPGGEVAVGTSDGRISADRVRAADLEGDISSILAGVSAPEAELLRLLILAPAERLRMRNSLGDELFSSGLARSLWHGLRAALDATIETGASVTSGEQIPAAVQGKSADSLRHSLRVRANLSALSVCASGLIRPRFALKQIVSKKRWPGHAQRSRRQSVPPTSPGCESSWSRGENSVQSVRSWIGA